jgi:hypothetical protein
MDVWGIMGWDCHCVLYWKNKYDLYSTSFSLCAYFLVIIVQIMYVRTQVKAGCKGDANVLRPTLMCTVPLILEREVVSRLFLNLVRHLDCLSLFLEQKFGEVFFAAGENV